MRFVHAKVSAVKNLYFALVVGMIVFNGCAMPQSPEARSREIQERRDADKRNKAFTSGLPPVQNAEQPIRY